MGRTLTIDQAKARALEDLLREVSDRSEPVRIELPGGGAVEIRPASEPERTLKPLETLPGYVPEGWKDAIYEPKR